MSDAGAIYLDYNGTCPVDGDVRKVIESATSTLWENPSSTRGGGPACKAAIEEARALVAGMIHALPEEITFTSGGTEANNMVIYSTLAEHQFQRSSTAVEEGNVDIDTMPHIITTNIEHPSVSRLLEHLESKELCKVTRIPVNTQTGAISEFDVFQAVQNSTCLISIMWANNETGVIQPVPEVAKILERVNADRRATSLPPIRLHTDVAQAIGKVHVRVDYASPIDYLTIVGHKFYGPRIGALYVRKGIRTSPLFFGGGQESDRRPGTENTPMIVGLGKAAEIVAQNLSTFTDQMMQMRDYLETLLQETFGADVVINYRSGVRLPNTSSVSFKNIPGTASDLLDACSRLVASTGAACHSGSTKPSSVLIACGISPNLAVRTVRLSVGRNTTKLEIAAVVEDLSKAVNSMKNVAVKDQ